MKKYWKTLVTLFVIMFGIGTYYIHAVIVAASLPEFEIKTISGDESYIDPIVIHAYYSSNQPDLSMQITSEGSLYRENTSIIDSLKGVPFSYERGLRERHGNFLRGLNYWGDNVYEDEEYLIVANIDYNRTHGINQSIRINYLNKKTKEEQSITYDLNERNHLSINDVQMNNDAIIVFARSWGYNEENGVTIDKIYAYHFDLTNNKFSKKEDILSFENIEYELNISMLRDSKSWSPNDYVVFRKNETNLNNYNAIEDIHDTSSLHAYHIETGNLFQINMPDEVVNKNERIHYFDGENLYITEFTNERVNIAVYSIQEGDLINELSIPFEKDEGLDPLISVSNGLIYYHHTIVTPDHDSSLKIYEANTGDLVYEGKIESEHDDYKLDIYLLNFKY